MEEEQFVLSPWVGGGTLCVHGGLMGTKGNSKFMQQNSVRWCLDERLTFHCGMLLRLRCVGQQEWTYWCDALLYWEPCLCWSWHNFFTFYLIHDVICAIRWKDKQCIVNWANWAKEENKTEKQNLESHSWSHMVDISFTGSKLNCILGFRLLDS